ncbi:s phase cyclin A-associated protein in the endoplasmic reticulum [Caerostris extrusa]|uniref:S phase cyclin A-associated protein in the endoplasmic reticulum n=1 Tax=Caerostris extrusa TaxID=172846 RepID=A0AAV4NVC2_CAEEX|nr:s phase cyclin A-associated protein in the endoplasmic reticulum [Caerostris extrusa]
MGKNTRRLLNHSIRIRIHQQKNWNCILKTYIVDASTDQLDPNIALDKERQKALKKRCKKILNNLCGILETVLDNSYEICKFILFSNKIGNLLDFLIHRLNNLIPDNIIQLTINQIKSSGVNIQLDANAGKLLHILTSTLTTLSTKQNPSNTDKTNDCDDFNLRMQDMISYIVSIGIVDKLSQFFNCVQGPINNETEVATFLLDCISFLSELIKLNSECSSSTSNRKTEDSTQLIATFRVTNMVGSVSFLYGLLLHSGTSSRTEGTPPPQLPKQIEVLAFLTLCMLNHMAVMNLQAFQSILGSEGLSLQLRHITSHLLWYCSHFTSEALLHEIILLVGYFTVLNAENQSIIQAGQRPTVLQQLCCLPFLYFSDTELTDILFPTLIACCYKNPANKTILQQEMTSELLSNYIEVKYLNAEENRIKENKTSVNDKRWLFSVRFPKCHWSSAKHYFSNA